MQNTSAKYTVLHRGRPIAWFMRRKDAHEMLCQLQWDGGQATYTMAKL
jgi:hypothetical protein